MLILREVGKNIHCVLQIFDNYIKIICKFFLFIKFLASDKIAT